MSHMIDDNRFVLIEKYKQKLIEGTNISDRPEEMAVIDSILFRLWQMGWLDKLEQSEPHWIPVEQELPEKSGEYLVTVKWVTGDCDVDVYEYDARHKTWNDGESAGGERAVAWCELPEPYKGVTT